MRAKAMRPDVLRVGVSDPVVSFSCMAEVSSTYYCSPCAATQPSLHQALTMIKNKSFY